MNDVATKTQILIIGGPTATGKTALGVELARRFDGEVINGDAYQIYRGMSIGTAKPTPDEIEGVPHHLLDFQDPAVPFSVAQFQQRAKKAILDIVSRGKLPIVVGGTGFYLSALINDMPLGSTSETPVRAKLQAQLKEVGAKALWKRLNALDPEAAAAIPVGNERRIIRALEVIETTGQKFSQQEPITSPYDALVIGLTTERALLYERINRRVDLMIEAGLEAEVRALIEHVPPNAQSLSAIGYKEMLPYLKGEENLEQAVELIKLNSRHFAKRQLTYFRHQLKTHWFDLIQDDDAGAAVDALVKDWLKKGE